MPSTQPAPFDDVPCNPEYTEPTAASNVPTQEEGTISAWIQDWFINAFAVLITLVLIGLIYDRMTSHDPTLSTSLKSALRFFNDLILAFAETKE